MVFINLLSASIGQFRLSLNEQRLIARLCRPKALLLMLSAILAGCATSPQSNEPTDAEIAATLDINDENFVPLPNPYLAQDITASSEAQQLFSEALAVLEAGNYADAQQKFIAITKAYPELSGPWVNLGLSYWRQQQFDAAAAAFEQAIAVNQLNIDAYNTFAVMAREQGNFAQAEALYLKAIDVWPHSPVSHLNLGVLYDMYMGRFDDALRHFEMAAKVTPDLDKQLQLKKQLRGWMIDIKRRQAKIARQTAARAAKADAAAKSEPAAAQEEAQ